MKTAEEMFEELGYDLIVDKFFIKYIKDIDQIIFDLKEKDISVYEYWCGEFTYHPITLKELQAINKQVEELGWLDE